MNPSLTDSLVLDALWIRRWARDLLAGREPEPHLIEHVQRAGPEAWRAVMEVERCAIHLFQAPAIASTLSQLSTAVRTLLDRFRLREVKRAMSVHAQLRQLAAEAAREGWRPVVLKGGVAIANGDYVDAQDLDVLASPAEIPAIIGFLEAAGAATSARPDAPIGTAESFHLQPRRAAHALQVEVHHAIRGLGPALALRPHVQPLTSHPGLYCLGDADHLYHLIFHATIHHPARAGSLRDVLLIELALRSASDACITSVRQRIRPLPNAQPLLQLLDFSASFRSEVAAPDPFLSTAAGNYLAAVRRGPHSRIPLYAATVSHLLHGGTQYRQWLGSLMRANGGPSSVPWVNRLAAWSPPLMTGGRRAYRAVILAAVLPGSVVFARHARRLARQFEVGMTADS